MTSMELMKQFFNKTHFVAHQIDSFNDFISNGMQAIIDREPEIESPTHRIKFGHVSVEPPKFIFPDRTIGPLMPNEARMRNINYEGTITVTVKVTPVDSKMGNGQPVEHLHVPIGKMPIMLRSNLCNLTEHNKIEEKECSKCFGGYFIIKGKERVLVGQLRRVYNRVFVEHKPEEKHKYIAEIRSMNEQGASVLIQAKIDDKKNLFFSLPYIKALLPAGLVFKALGISEEEMVEFVRIDDDQVITSLSNQYHSEPTPEDVV